MKRIKTSIPTRLLAGSYVSLLLSGPFMLMLALVLFTILTGKQGQPDETAALWSLFGVISLMTALYFSYVFIRLGIFIDGDEFVERRFFKTYRLKLADIKIVSVASFANSSAAGNVVSLITNPDFSNAGQEGVYTIRNLLLMSSKKRSWSVAEEIIRNISQYNPQVVIAGPVAGAHSLWQGFDDYIASKGLATKQG